MRSDINPFNELERKEACSVLSLLRRSQPLTTTAMHNASKILPIHTRNGIVDIPAAAFQPLQREVRDRFEVELFVHKHNAGVNHGEFVPVDHYLLELQGESTDRINEAIDAIDDRVNALVERFTLKSSTDVPAGR